MFSDRLDEIMNALGTDNNEIARLSGFDRTYISKFRNGKRTPRIKGASAGKISAALIACAKEHSETDTLVNITGSLEISGVNEYLFKDEERIRRSGKTLKSRKRSIGSSFSPFSGNNLSRAMFLADMSNAQLSRLVNVDASLISRYRTGSRRIDTDSDIAGNIASLLLSRIERKGLLPELASITGVSISEINKEYFLGWLCDPELNEKRAAQSAEKLLNAFSSLDGNTGISLPSLKDAAPSSILNETKEYYSGYGGFRDACIRFLGNVIEQGVDEIQLYSDQGMEWMINDKAFLLKWTALMKECVDRGTRISIIHNIDRSLSEMNQAIISWLPLYMSGMIRPYYCQKKPDERFSHSIFLCPGKYCISGSHIRGTEKNGIYRFITEDPELEILHEGMNRLFSYSLPLVSITSEPETEKDIPEDAILLDPSSFKNMSILVSDEYVRIKRLTEPCLTFTFTHPLLCQAFLSYAERNFFS